MVFCRISHVISMILYTWFIRMNIKIIFSHLVLGNFNKYLFVIYIIVVRFYICQLKSVTVPVKSVSRKSSRKSSVSMDVDTKPKKSAEAKVKSAIPQMNKDRKKDFKRMKKQRKRAGKKIKEEFMI